MQIWVDADACPVREEAYRVAARYRLTVHVVSNGSRPIRPVPVALIVSLLVYAADQLGYKSVCNCAAT